MEKAFNGTERIQIFAFELIALIAQGKKENIKMVETQIANENIVRYIREQYRDLRIECTILCLGDRGECDLGWILWVTKWIETLIVIVCL